MLVSENEELTLGKNAAPSLNWGFGGRYHDPELEAYLEGIVRRIWQNSERPHLPMKFSIQNTSIPNAFALPGYVAITRGLLSELENEAQFVAIMGHEAGHVMARHTAQRVSLGTLQQFGLIIGGAALEGKRGGDALLTLGAVGSGLILLKYDRSQELQADRLGVKYMARLGYNPYEALTAHRRLEIAIDNYLKRAGKTRREDTFISELLSTHPRAAVRIEEIQTMVKELPPYTIQQVGDSTLRDGKFEERFQRAIHNLKEVNKAYIVYDDAERLYEKNKLHEAEEKLNIAISINNSQAPFYNLLGMIRLRSVRLATEQKNYSEAEGAFRRALSIDSGYQPSFYGLGLTELFRKDYYKAIPEFKKSIHLYPEHPGSHFGLGKSYFSIGYYRDAIPHLKNFAAAAPKHNEVHGLLGICYENSNDLRAAVREYEIQIRIEPDSDLGRYCHSRLLVLRPLMR
ncbi:MAG: M48 family metalloprotease [Nitrospirae bacterium]|nr:M48 family metalloprotease [Nitrospirota bacterium]